MFNWFKTQPKPPTPVSNPALQELKRIAALEVILFKCRSGRYTVEEARDLVLKLYGKR